MCYVKALKGDRIELSNCGLISGAFAEQSAHTGGIDLSAKGDMHGYSDDDARIPISTNNFSLLCDSAQSLGLKWAASPTSLLSAAGDILYASGANTLAKLAKQDNDDVLTLKSGLPSWEPVAAGGGTNLFYTHRALIGSNDSFFLWVYGPSDADNTVEEHTQCTFSSDGTAKNLRVQSTTNSLNGTCVWMIRKNKGDTALTVTQTAGSTAEFSDLSNTFSISAGDKINIEYDASGSTSGTSANINVSFEVDYD